MQETRYTAPIEAKLGYEMDHKGFSRRAQEKYIYHVKKFFEYVQKEPRRATITDVRKYVRNLKKERKSEVCINETISAITFLYRDIWKRSSFSELEKMKQQSLDEQYLSREQIKRMSKVMPQTKDKLLIELFFASGLPIEEIITITTRDIHLDDKLLVIQSQQGSRRRYIMLSDDIIEHYIHYLTERYYLGVQNVYIFYDEGHHLSEKQALHILKKSAAKSGIDFSFF